MKRHFKNLSSLYDEIPCIPLSALLYRKELNLRNLEWTLCVILLLQRWGNCCTPLAVSRIPLRMYAPHGAQFQASSEQYGMMRQ